MTKNENLEIKINEMICSEPFQELEQAVRQLSIFSLVGTTNTERWHSAFIAWLLNANAEHNLGDYALKQLLIAMRLKIEKENPFNKKFKNIPSLVDIESGEFIECDVMPDATSIERNKEKTVKVSIDKKKSKKCSFDVALTALFNTPSTKNNKKLLLIIENKIKAKESYDQTTYYAHWALNSPTYPISSSSHEKKINNVCLLFLTPCCSSPKDPNFLALSYQEFMDKVLVPCFYNKQLSSRGKLLIEEYMEMLSDAGYCLRARDHKCVKQIMKEYKETFDDMMAAASCIQDDSDTIKAKNDKKYPYREKKYADAVLSSRKEVFLLIERVIQSKNPEFQLPQKYTKTSYHNINYSTLLDMLDVDENGAIPAYFKKHKEEVAYVNITDKPYKIIYKDNDGKDNVDSALNMTKLIAKKLGKSNKSGQYQWSAYWIIKGGKFKDKSFNDAYKQYIANN